MSCGDDTQRLFDGLLALSKIILVKSALLCESVDTSRALLIDLLTKSEQFLFLELSFLMDLAEIFFDDCGYFLRFGGGCLCWERREFLLLGALRLRERSQSLGGGEELQSEILEMLILLLKMFFCGEMGGIDLSGFPVHKGAFALLPLLRKSIDLRLGFLLLFLRLRKFLLSTLELLLHFCGFRLGLRKLRF